VTAEDVANSLYYVHLNTEDDLRLVSNEPSIIEEEEYVEIVQKPFPRKPLPESSRSSFELNRQHSALLEPLKITSTSRKIERKPLSPAVHKHVPSHAEAKGNVQNRPLGPRPLLSESSLIIGREPLPGMDDRPSSSGSQPRGTEFVHEASSNSRPRFLDLGGSSAFAAPKKSFSITVIRRDASSCAQWNIGSVIGESHDQEPQSPSSKKVYFDMSVHLTAPGYTQFRDHKSNSPLEHGNTGSEFLNSAPQHLRDGLTPVSFVRQIRMEGMSFWDRSKQHRRAQSDSPGSPNSPRGWNGSAGSPKFDGFIADQLESHDSGVKGYVFRSPWGGRCKFTTSGSGRSLRCKHALPGPVSISNTTDTASLSEVTVSELRFNLPSSAMFQSPTSPNLKGQYTESRRFHIPKLSHIRNKLSPDKARPPLPPRPHPTSYVALYPSDDERPELPPQLYTNHYNISSDDDTEEAPVVPDRLHPFPYSPKSASEEDDNRLDLSLGQEMAGGGNRGKRVKLGKLIIMDEGTKMLDLIVAANMGIWWSVWEATT